MTIPGSDCTMEDGSTELPRTPEEESRIIEDLMTKAESNLREGDNYYVISTRWYVTWRKYTAGLEDSVERPGAIDNTDLVSPSHNSQFLRTLTKGRDYELLPEEVWGRLHEWYNGGPAIARKVIRGGYRKQLRVETFPLCLNLVDSRDGSCCVVQLSRKASLNELYDAVCQLKGLERDKVRIFDYKYQTKRSILCASNETLEDSNLMKDHHILLEPEDDGLWSSAYSGRDSTAMVPMKPFPYLFKGGFRPGIFSSSSDADMDGRPCPPLFKGGYSSGFRTNMYPGIPSSSSDADMDGSEHAKRQEVRGGLVGLHNLGNTCFMNTSLQCLAHTPPIMDYFLQDYTYEINKENVLGMSGELALAFGKLLRKLWSSGKTSVPPREFKQKLAHFAPQFDGYKQHDSQELLAFLLDGLHEDLNRVKEKPYIETMNSDGRRDEEVADEFWSYHKARNNSIIFDVCQGQYKSTLVCPSCNKISITFDPFMYLSLPLPLTGTRTMTVTVFYGDGSGLPVEITVTVPKHGSCQDLIEALATECNLSADEYLLLADVNMHKVYTYFWNPSEELLGDIKDFDRTVAYRLPKRSMNFPKLEITHRFLEKSKYWSDVKRLFLTPLVTFLEDPESSEDIDQSVDRVLAPFRKNCTSPLFGPDEDMSTNSSETEEPELTFHPAKNSFGSNFQPILRKNSEVPVVSVTLDWTEREKELYDDSCLKEVPTTGLNAKEIKQEAVSLFSCLDAFLKEEPLEPDNMWYCPDCKERRLATKKLDLWRLPNVLVFHLKRFSHSRWYTDKLDTFVEFPIRDLDLSGYVGGNDKAPGDHVYELYAISNHYGGLGSGHYSAYCKLIDDDNKWYHFDDSHVSEIDEVDITTPAAYVLFYRRVGSKSNEGVEESSQIELAS